MDSKGLQEPQSYSDQAAYSGMQPASSANECTTSKPGFVCLSTTDVWDWIINYLTHHLGH